MKIIGEGSRARPRWLAGFSWRRIILTVAGAVRGVLGRGLVGTEATATLIGSILTALLTAFFATGGRRPTRIESLLRVADLGVVGLIVDETLLAEKQVGLLHRGKAGKSIPFGFATHESLGPHACFAFLGPVLQVLEQGSVLVADELDSSLHPLLAAESRAFVQSGISTDMRSSPDPRPTKGLPDESVSCHVDSA